MDSSCCKDNSFIACPTVVCENNAQIEATTSMNCPSSHPWAYLNGQYCCAYQEERNEVKEGDACDGSKIGLDSSCCKDNSFISCPTVVCGNNAQIEATTASKTEATTATYDVQWTYEIIGSVATPQWQNVVTNAFDKGHDYLQTTYTSAVATSNRPQGFRLIFEKLVEMKKIVNDCFPVLVLYSAKWLFSF